MNVRPKRSRHKPHEQWVRVSQGWLRGKSRLLIITLSYVLTFIGARLLLSRRDSLSRSADIALPMDGKPNSGFVGRCPFDAMPHVRRNVKVVPRSEHPRLDLCLEQ